MHGAPEFLALGQQESLTRNRNLRLKNMRGRRRGTSQFHLEYLTVDSAMVRRECRAGSRERHRPSSKTHRQFVSICTRKDFKIMAVTKSAGHRICGSRESHIRGAVARAGVLLCMTLFSSEAALAQTIAATPPDTERLNAQVQSASKHPPPPAATPNPDCTLIVPANPLTAAGLSTPYQLVATDPGQGPCSESNTAQSAFVQAAIFDPITSVISIYSPLVVDKADSPLVPPVVPTLPAGAIVATWFGYNGGNLTLQGATAGVLSGNQCVNGASNTVFGQYAYCNAPAFFNAANAAISSGKLEVPAVGTANDGKPCPTVRDFFVIDQDQSDNLPTLYLVSPRGHLSQFTKKNQANHPSSVPLGNPSDNRLTDAFVDPAIGCKPWTAPDLADPGSRAPALALNELSARMGQVAPVALVPGGDPMTEVNGTVRLNKTNLYRQGVDQPLANSNEDIDTARYCRQMLRIAPQRMLANQKALTAFTTPDGEAANSLYTFLAQRFDATYQLLNCATLVNAADPVSITLDRRGVAVSAAINSAQLNQLVQKLAPFKAGDDAEDSVERSRRKNE
jgi:hypothetical protein